MLLNIIITFKLLLMSFNFKVRRMLRRGSPLPLECLPCKLSRVTSDTVSGELTLKGDFNDGFPERSGGLAPSFDGASAVSALASGVANSLY